MADSQDIYGDFSPAGYDAWKQQAVKEVKGVEAFAKLFKTTPEGVTTQPFYTLDDIEGKEFGGITKPAAGWKIVERIKVTNSGEARTKATIAFEKGADEVILEVGAEEGLVSLHYLPANCKIWWRGNTQPDGNILADRLLISAGNNEAINTGSEVLVDASVYHNSGAETCFELACTLAHVNEYYNDRFVKLSKFDKPIMVNLAIGSNYFFEIAKLRALRQLLSIVGEQYGITQQPLIYCETALNNKTIYDYNNNILRATNEAMAAIIGGCDGLYVHPYDVLFKQPNDFSARIARNIQLILRYESHLDKITDAAKGSFYIDNLTEEIARKSWDLFKDIEAKGGWMACIQSGYLQDTIKQQAEAALAAVEAGKQTVLGVNKYPNKNEKMSGEMEQVEIYSNTLFPLRRLVEEKEKERLNNEV